jgi:hypothetical protein
MSRSTFPGTTLYHSALTVYVMCVRSKRKGEFAAFGAVCPENESFKTFIWAAMSVSHWVRCVADSWWSETTWKTVGT